VGNGQPHRARERELPGSAASFKGAAVSCAMLPEPSPSAIWREVTKLTSTKEKTSIFLPPAAWPADGQRQARSAFLPPNTSSPSTGSAAPLPVGTWQPVRLR